MSDLSNTEDDGVVPGRLRAGLVGCGLIGSFHSFMLARASKGGVLPIELGPVYDRDTARAESFANWGWTPVRSVDEVCETADAVWVAVPTKSHREIVEAAAARRRAIFCEKPLGRSLAEAGAIAALAEGLTAQVGLVLRSLPPQRIAKAEIDAGNLGEIQGIVLRDDQFVPIQGMYASSWRGDPEEAGSGVLLEHSIHDLDLIDWLAGPVTWVSAEIRSFLDIAPGIEDAASAQLGLAAGGIASLATFWHNVSSRPSTRHISIMGTEGVLVIEDEARGPVQIHRGDSAEALHGDSLVERFRRLEPAWASGASADAEDIFVHGANEDAWFCRAVLGGLGATPDFADALRAHRLVDACYRSGATAGDRIVV